MSNLRNTLIRKAATLPKGDSTRLQLIELARKHAAGYSITERGLEPTKSGLYLQPNTILYYGASSTPTEIIVTRVTDDTVYFKIHNRRGGFTDSQERRWVFEDLAISGSKTWLRSTGKHFPEEAASVKRLLSGKPGKTINVSQYVEGFKEVEVEVEATQPANTYPRGDAWYAAEEYGGVGGRYEGAGMEKVRQMQERARKLEEGAAYNSPEAEEAKKLWRDSYALEAQQRMVYIINTDKARLDKLKKDNRFKVLKVKSA